MATVGIKGLMTLSELKITSMCCCRRRCPIDGNSGVLAVSTKTAECRSLSLGRRDVRGKHLGLKLRFRSARGCHLARHPRLKFSAVSHSQISYVNDERLCHTTLLLNNAAYDNCQFSIGKQQPNKHGF